MLTRLGIFIILSAQVPISERKASVRVNNYLRAVVLAGLWVVLDSTGQAFACSCAVPAGPLCGRMSGDVAFVGTPSGPAEVLREGRAARKFVFRIQEVFSGVNGAFVDVFSDNSSCGLDFVSGTSYLVDAEKDSQGNITVSLCSFTQPAAKAPEEIAILRRIAARQSPLGILGQLVEFRPQSRLSDPEVLEPLSQVAVEILEGSTTRRTTTDGSGRFAVWDLPPGVYRVRVELKPPLRLWKYTPGFQLHADPDRIDLLHCPARVELIASRRK
jgi:hypothetical protein